MNYIKLFEDGTSEAVDVKPSWGMYEKEHALDNREVYMDGNWYSTTGGELLVGTDFSDGLLGNWTSVNNGVPTIVNNQLKIVDASPYSSGVEQTITCNIGDKIVVKYYTSGIRAAALWLDSLILYSSDTGTYIGEVSEEFIATSTSHIISLQTGSSIDRDDLYIDNISVYKVEPTIDTLQPPHTYLSNKGKLAGIEVANGIPVDIHYDELAPTLVEDTIKVSNLVVTDGFDLGQSWVNVTASRALDVTYTNDTGKPIKIVGEIQSAGTGGYGAALYINNIVIQLPIQYSLNLGYKIVISEIIPNGDTYKISDTSGTLTRWSELR